MKDHPGERQREISSLSRPLCWSHSLHTAWKWPMIKDRPSLRTTYACVIVRVLVTGIGWVESWARYWKVASSSPGRSGERVFFSRVNFLCWLLFGVCSTSALLQWHVKGSCHSAKSTGVRFHLNTHTPITQWSWSGLTMLSWHSVETYQGNELALNLSGNTRPQLSQLSELLWTHSGLKSGIGACELIFT